MLAVLDTLTTITWVLPANIDISPNDSGLPGIAALRTVVGAVMTIGLILSVLALIISAVVWGFGSNSLQPASGVAGEGRGADLLRGRDHHRRSGDADQLLLERRPDRLLTTTPNLRKGGVLWLVSVTSPSSATSATPSAKEQPPSWLHHSTGSPKQSEQLRPGSSKASGPCSTPPPWSTSPGPGMSACTT